MNEAIKRITVIIPSFNPDERLKSLLDGLRGQGFDDIIIINDGSDAENLKYFPAAGEYPECTLLAHSENRGKGAALRTGFEFVVKNRPEKVGVVTADCDGQHIPEDIAAVANGLCESPDTLILGVRDFSLSEVPANYRIGSKFTSFVFRTGAGLKISDTQTGLRGIPAAALPNMLNIKGDRYEYETNMLMSLDKYGMSYREITIRTSNIGKSGYTHFRIVADSVRIYANIIKYTANSLISSLLDLIIFYLIMRFVFHGDEDGFAAVAICTVSARVLSNSFNFAVSQIIVFGNRSNAKRSLKKYLVVTVIQMMLSALLVYVISWVVRSDHSAITTAIKMPVDVTLFFVGYYFQRKWVFNENKDKI